MATASSAAYACINQIRKRGQGILLCLDIRKAFDSIFHDLMEAMMDKIFVDSNFSSIWMRWTNQGTAFISIDDKVSDTFEIKKGVGQGDSSSSAKYIIMHQVFIAALTSPKMQHLLFELDSGAKLAPISFADDTLICLQLSGEDEVELLEKAFQIVGKATGLCINPSKTAILSLGWVPANINKIGKVQDTAKHLGIQLSFDHDLAYRKTYDAALEKMQGKASQIFFSHRDNLIKRRMIVTTMLSFCAYHIMSVFLPLEKEAKK